MLMLGPDLHRSKGGMTNWARDTIPHLEDEFQVDYVPTFSPGLASKAKALVNAHVPCFFEKRYPHLVHLNIAGPTSAVRKTWLAAAFLMKETPTIIHLHGGQLFRDCGSRRRKIALAVWRQHLKNTTFVVLGEIFKRELERELPCAKINVIPNGTETTLKWKPEPVVRFVFGGNLTKEKGFIDLSRALSHTPSTSRWEFHVCGEGPALELGRHLLAKQISAGQVQFHGWTTRAEFHQILSCGGILVLPSYWEGLPLVVLEALSIGGPVIASRTGAVSEYVNGNCGILVEPGDVEQLRNALMRFIDESQLAFECSLGQPGKRILNNIEAASSLKEAYRSALEGQQRRLVAF